jgi:hypothetical protein
VSDLPAVPDYFGQFVAPLQRQQALGIEQQNANLQQQQIVQQQQAMLAKARAQQQYQQDAAEVIANPTPEGFRALMLKYPEAARQPQGQHGDNYGRRRAAKGRTSAASQVYAALANGQHRPRCHSFFGTARKRTTGAGNRRQAHRLSSSTWSRAATRQKIKQAQGMAGYVLATCRWARQDRPHA